MTLGRRSTGSRARWTAASVVVAILGFASCAPAKTAASHRSTAKPGTGSGTTSGGPGPCNIALAHDTYDGFHIGVPSGWSVATSSGTIIVSKDPPATEQSTVTPVLMTAGLTPASIFTSSLSGLEKEVAAAGGSMTDTVTSSGDRSPAATLSLHHGEVALTGQARLVVLPEATAHGSSVAALLASWAPPADFAADRATLAGIGDCYGPEPGALYRVMKDQVFTYAIPADWTVKGESQDAIEIDDGNDAAVSYTLALLQPGTGVDSPQSLLDYMFANMGIHIDKTLAAEQAPNTRTANGGTQGQEWMQFTGTFKGRAIHGSAIVLSETGTSSPSGVLRLAVATPDLWNSVNGALTHVMNSIQHSFSQDLQQWQRISRQQQGFNQQVQGFDYALTSLDLVHDPATGATFEAPYDAYRATGPDGPGYYDQANVKLQIVTPNN